MRDNCRVKIASKNRNSGDAKFFVVKNKGQTQKAGERSKGRGLAICRRRKCTR